MNYFYLLFHPVSCLPFFSFLSSPANFPCFPLFFALLYPSTFFPFPCLPHPVLTLSLLSDCTSLAFPTPPLLSSVTFSRMFTPTLLHPFSTVGARCFWSNIPYRSNSFSCMQPIPLSLLSSFELLASPCFSCSLLEIFQTPLCTI